MLDLSGVVERSEVKTDVLCLFNTQYKLLKSKYIGFTRDLKTRLKDHNDGKSPYTSKFKPWVLVAYIAFSDKTKALQLEKYKESFGQGFCNEKVMVVESFLLYKPLKTSTSKR